MSLVAQPFVDVRWFEDFEAEREFRFGDWPMQVEEMVAFARQFDPEPFHLDEAAARAAGWPGLIASGPMLCAIWRRLSKEAFPQAETVISPGWDEIRWLAPVLAGDRLHSRTRVAEVRRLDSRPGEGLVRLAVGLFNQVDTPVTRFVSNWFVRCRPIS